MIDTRPTADTNTFRGGALSLFSGKVCSYLIKKRLPYRELFTGPYSLRKNGAWQEWLLARLEDLAFVSDAIDDVVAASLPVAWLTAQITLTLTGFKPGMTALAPAIGGSVGNATYSSHGRGAPARLFRRPAARRKPLAHASLASKT
jgi:hypothetical protein